MTSKELYEKYIKAMNERATLEYRLNDYIEQSKTGKKYIKNRNIVDREIKKATAKLSLLVQQEEELHKQYIAMVKKEQEKLSADISLKYHLGKSPSNITITGGVLSSNANESHLIGETKTPEQLKQDKVEMLQDIKSRFKNGKFSLAEASKLNHDVNASYDCYNYQDECDSYTGKHK